MDYVEFWRLKRRIEYLETVRGVGHTSILSLLIRPDDQMCKIRNMLSEELGRANNIKADQNRSSVQEGLKSIGEYLKLHKTIPSRGIACFYATSVMDPLTGGEKRLKIYFEPPRPLGRFVYSCGSSARTEALREMLKSEDAFGFIVVDGKGAMLAVVRGTEKEVKSRFTVDLPRKHGRGGQSAVRFARLREEQRANYLNQVCERAKAVYITDDKPNVSALILAGQAQFKDELEKTQNLDPRLKAIVRATLTTSYGDYQGLNEAIKLSADTLGNLRLAAEIKLVAEFMVLIGKGRDDMVAYGVRSTMNALEEGAVTTLLVWEGLGIIRYLLRDKNSGENAIRFSSPRENAIRFSSLRENVDPNLEIMEEQLLIEWLADHVKDYGSKLELITDRSQEGAMLKFGFGGIVALLRYSRIPEVASDEESSIDPFSEMAEM